MSLRHDALVPLVVAKRWAVGCLTRANLRGVFGRLLVAPSVIVQRPHHHLHRRDSLRLHDPFSALTPLPSLKYLTGSLAFNTGPLRIGLNLTPTAALSNSPILDPALATFP